MSNYVHLIGSEDVSRAGHNMQRAAEQMSRAAAQFDSTVDRLQSILEEHAARIEAASEKDNVGA